MLDLKNLEWLGPNVTEYLLLIEHHFNRWFSYSSIEAETSKQ
jgi:hypothetical protein